MRFFDEIIRRGVTKATPSLKMMHAGMSGATVVAVDNVTEYYYVLNDQEDWVFPRDFPNVAPPFGNMFVESGPPSKVVSSAFGVSDWDGADKWGMWMKTTDMKTIREDMRPKIIARINEAGPGALGPMLVSETRWFVEILSFFMFAPSHPLTTENRQADTHIGTAGKAYMFVRDDGSAIQFEGNYPGEAWLWQGIAPHTDHLETMLRTVAKIDSMGTPPMASHCREFFRILLQPCLLALSFAHCKNVVMVDEQAPRQQRRAAEREGKPLTIYKTLRIAPIETAIQHRGTKGQSGVKLRMHIRRGGFRDYRQGKGLFGKLHGLYWWEPAIVGDPEKGVIEKDYSIAPKAV